MCKSNAPLTNTSATSMSKLHFSSTHFDHGTQRGALLSGKLQ
jgi:hypothetical protein